jgi:hypothetical protein
VLRQHRFWANWSEYLCTDCNESFVNLSGYRAHVAAALAAVVSSPATPEGGDGYPTPEAEGWGVERRTVVDLDREPMDAPGTEEARGVGPWLPADTVRTDCVYLDHSECPVHGEFQDSRPSPASPAETREGLARKIEALEWARPAARGVKAAYRMGVHDAAALVRASPAVSLPGEQPGGDETCAAPGCRFFGERVFINHSHEPPALPGERADKEKP